MADDGHPAHAEQRGAAIGRVVQMADQLAHARPLEDIGRAVADEADEHPSGRLVEFEHHIAHESIADHHVDGDAPLRPGQDVPTFDVSGVVETRGALEQLVDLAHDRGALLFLLAHVEEADDRIGPAQQVSHVDGAEIGEADQLAGRAVEIGATVEHQDRLGAGGKERGDGGPLDPVMEPEQHRGGGERGAGVAGGHEGVGLPGPLQGQADHDARVRLPPHRGQRLLGHPDNVSRLVDLEAALVGLRIVGQLGLDHIATPDQLHQKFVRQVRERFDHPGDLRLWGAVAPHGVHRDADHAQASSTSTCFLPR